jgi:hypothetical protein
MGKIAYSWQLMGASWNVLKQDTKLLIFPLLSGICCLIVIASFIIPIVASGHASMPDHRLTQQEKIVYYATLFCFYFANYFVITFFNVAIVSCAVARMAGGEPTIAGGLRESFKRIHLIAGWALLAATVGLVLRIVENYSKRAGAIIAGILGAVWSIMTFLVVPVIVVEDKGPIEAAKRSAGLLKQTWGEQLAGNFSFGIVFFLLGIPGIIGIVAGVIQLAQNHTTLGGTMLGISVLYFVLLALVQSALAAIFQAAVYMYTQGVTDSSPRGQGFPVTLLRDAMSSR